MSVEVAEIIAPTILEFWAPACVECRAMKRDLEEVAATFPAVEHRRINVVESTAVARDLGVMSTPTLLAIADGKVIFRTVGRRTRGELQEVFRATASRNHVSGVGRQDRVLRTGAGLALAAVGAAIGPAWPLVGVGAVVTTWGLASKAGTKP